MRPARCAKRNRKFGDIGVDFGHRPRTLVHHDTIAFDAENLQRRRRDFDLAVDHWPGVSYDSYRQTSFNANLLAHAFVAEISRVRGRSFVGADADRNRLLVRLDYSNEQNPFDRLHDQSGEFYVESKSENPKKYFCFQYVVSIGFDARILLVNVDHFQLHVLLFLRFGKMERFCICSFALHTCINPFKFASGNLLAKSENSTNLD